MAIKNKSVGIVGARALPQEYKNNIQEVVKYLVNKNYVIHSGGALGADLFVLESLISLGAVSKGRLFSAWSELKGFPKEVQKFVEYFVSHQGEVSWGLVPPHSSRSVAVAGLLARNKRLVEASDGLVAFLYGDSNGTCYTVRESCQKGQNVVVFLCGDKAQLPQISFGQWVKLKCSAPWSEGYLFKKN